MSLSRIHLPRFDCTLKMLTVDRVSVRAALTGCLALLQRKEASSEPPLAASSAVTLVRRMVQHIQVQAFGQPERMLAFEVLQTAVEVSPAIASALL